MGNLPPASSLVCSQVVNVTGVSVGFGLSSACDTLISQVSSSPRSCHSPPSWRVESPRANSCTFFSSPAASKVWPKVSLVWEVVFFCMTALCCCYILTERGCFEKVPFITSNIVELGMSKRPQMCMCVRVTWGPPTNHKPEEPGLGGRVGSVLTGCVCRSQWLISSCSRCP